MRAPSPLPVRGLWGITALAPYVTLPAEPCALPCPEIHLRLSLQGEERDRCCPRSVGLNSQQQSRLGNYAGASEGKAHCPEPVPAWGRGDSGDSLTVLPQGPSVRPTEELGAGRDWCGDGLPTCHWSCLQAGLQPWDVRSRSSSGGTGAAAGFAPPCRVPSAPLGVVCPTGVTRGG